MIISDSTSELVEVSALGGILEFGKGLAKLVIQRGMVEEGDTLEFEVTTWMMTGQESTIVEITGPDGGEFSTASLSQGGWLELWIPYTPKPLSYPTVERRADSDSKWSDHSDGSLEYDQGTYYAVININEGGQYRAVNQPHLSILAFLIAGSAFFCVIGGIVIKKCVVPNFEK
jgi:hypothetical protein